MKKISVQIEEYKSDRFLPSNYSTMYKLYFTSMQYFKEVVFYVCQKAGSLAQVPVTLLLVVCQTEREQVKVWYR